MFWVRKVRECFAVTKFYIKNVRLICYYDKNFDSFRSKTEYKNLMVQPMEDVTKYKTSFSSSLSFAKKGEDAQIDGFFYHLHQRENVMKLSTSQVKDVLSILANSEFDAAKYALALRFLDEKCAVSAERWPLDLTFYVFDAWLHILGPKTFRKHYYSAITSQWSRRIGKCSKSNLILVLYFIGISKSAVPFLMDSVLDHMEDTLPHFSDEEIAIACLSLFKCSRKVKSRPFLQRSCGAAENLLERNDSFNAISILKCLRLSKYYDAKLYKVVQNFALQKYSTFNLVECTNFLALFSSQNFYHKEVFDVLEVQAMTALKMEEDTNMSEESFKTHPSLRSRVKDLARFLWTLTSVGHPIKEDTLSSVTNCIEKRLRLGEYESQLPVLIDTLQSFVLADHYPENIFSTALTSTLCKRICSDDKSKPKYQLYFVEKSVTIEHPEISITSPSLMNPIPKNLDKDFQARNGFRKLFTFLNEKFPFSFKRCYIMPHIMIAGIYFSKPCTELSSSLDVTHRPNGIICKQVQGMIKSNCKNFCIEILDSSVCAGENFQAVGLMQTKIRQLKKLNFQVILLTPDDIENLTETDISPKCEIEELFREKFV